MIAQNELSQQTSYDFRSSIYGSSFCAKSHAEADFMGNFRDFKGRFIKGHPEYRKNIKGKIEISCVICNKKVLIYPSQMTYSQINPTKVGGFSRRSPNLNHSEKVRKL